MRYVSKRASLFAFRHALAAILLAVVFMVWCGGKVSAQNQNDGVEFYFGTFESNTTEGFVNAAVVNNPQPDETNPTAKVLHYSDGAWWGPSKWNYDGHFTVYHQKLRVDVFLPEGALQDEPWSDNPLSMFILHARNCEGAEIPHWQSPAKLIYEEETWITLEFDLSELPNMCYRNLILAGSSPIGFYSDNYRWLLDLEPMAEGEIFAENFEGATFPPENWTVHALAAEQQNWTRSHENNLTPLGTYAAYHASVDADQHKNWLITPPIQLPSDKDYDLSFWSLNLDTDWYEAMAGNLNSVWLSTAGNDPESGAFEKIWEAVTVSSSWQETIISLHEYTGQEIHIAFVYEGYMFAHQWFLDNVSVREGLPRAFVNMLPVNDCAANHIDIHLEMDNRYPVVAFQFDIIVPEGFAVLPQSVNLPRSTNHVGRATMVNDTLMRVIGYSPNNEGFTGQSGVFASFGMHAANDPGTHVFLFNRAIAADADGNNVLFSANRAPILLDTATTVILTHPQPMEVIVGSPATFSVVAEGENLTYQWYFNNEPITDANESNFTIAQAQEDHQGYYHCTVSGDCGILISNAAWLEVDTPLFTVTFLVKDTEGVEIEDATITIADSFELITDHQGQAQTELPPGSYPYSVAVDGFTVFSGLFFVSNSPVTIDVTLVPLMTMDNPDDRLQIFPNPFSQNITIADAHELVRFSIIDMFGSVIKHGEASGSGEFVVPTATWHNGVYFLIMETLGGDFVVRKLIKSD